MADSYYCSAYPVGADQRSSVPEVSALSCCTVPSVAGIPASGDCTPAFFSHTLPGPADILPEPSGIQPELSPYHTHDHNIYMKQRHHLCLFRNLHTSSVTLLCRYPFQMREYPNRIHTIYHTCSRQILLP